MEQKQISIHQEYKILRAIDKVFYDNNNKYMPIDENAWFVTCPANVSMIQAKSDFGKKLLLRFLNIDENGQNNIKTKKPILEYEKDIGYPMTRVSMDYLSNILEIFKYDDSVKISVKHDYPITIENKDFWCVIAPRIEQDE
jgi:hypothetical protein